MKYIHIVTAIVLACSFSSCIIQKKKDVDLKVVEQRPEIKEQFHTLSIKGDFELNYVQGDTSCVIVKGPKSLVEKAKITAENGILNLNGERRKISFGRNKSKVTVIVMNPELAKVIVSGACNFHADESVTLKNLYFDISGAGDVDFENLTCDSLIVDVKGAGDIDVNLHNTPYTSVSISGAGQLDADFDNCGTAICNISGAGDVELSGDLENLVESKSGVATIVKKDLRIKNK